MLGVLGALALALAIALPMFEPMAGGIATIGGTTIEDVLTGGVGIVDDPITIAVGVGEIASGVGAISGAIVAPKVGIVSWLAAIGGAVGGAL